MVILLFKKVYKMNIVFTLGSSLNPIKGGVGRVTDIIAKTLITKGYNIYYLTLENDLNKWNSPVKQYFLPSPELYSDENIVFYHEFLLEKKIDIIVNQAGEWGDSKFFLNTGSLKCRRISVFHSRPFRDYDKYKLSLYVNDKNILKKYLKIFIKLFYIPIYNKKIIKRIKSHFEFLSNNSDTIVLLSERYFPQIMENINSQCQLYAIPNPNTYSRIPFIENKEKIILFVGRLDTKIKHPERIIKAFNIVNKKYPDYKLVICGGGPDEDIIKKIAGNNKNIIFTGFIAPEEYYERASILCVTSNFEGFPMVLTEAMQYSLLPIVYNTFEAVSDIIQNGNNGFVIPPRKTKLVNTLDYVLGLSSEKIKEFRTNAYENVQKFNVNNIINKWDNLFRSL